MQSKYVLIFFGRPAARARDVLVSQAGIIRMMDRLGCPFIRTPERNLAVHRFGRTLYHRTYLTTPPQARSYSTPIDLSIRSPKSHIPNLNNIFSIKLNFLLTSY